MDSTEFKVTRFDANGSLIEGEFGTDVLPQERTVDFGDIEERLVALEIGALFTIEDIRSRVFFELLPVLPAGVLLGIGDSPVRRVRGHLRKDGWIVIGAGIQMGQITPTKNCDMYLRAPVEELSRALNPGHRVNVIVAENVFTNDKVAADISLDENIINILKQIRESLMPGGLFYTGNMRNAFTPEHIQGAGFKLLRHDRSLGETIFLASRG
jgi:hypothetical protein